MNELYIKIDKDNKPINHPLLLSNMVDCFPNHNFNAGPPEGYLPFERVPEPELGPYEKWDESIKGEQCDAWSHNGMQYELVDGKIKDVWKILPLTDEEKKAKQDAVKDGAYASWTFNEELCIMEPPVPHPDPKGEEFEKNGKAWIWNESDRKWDEIQPPQRV